MANTSSRNSATAGLGWQGWLASLAVGEGGIAGSEVACCAAGEGSQVVVRAAGPAPTTLLARLALAPVTRVSAVALLGAVALLALALPPHSAQAAHGSAPVASNATELLGNVSAATKSTSLSVEPYELAPATLVETGLYADWASKTIAPDNIPFAPQYPLWSDGAHKQRWIYLPAAIDASRSDAWEFPVGTKIWKQFSFGARTETRFMQRTERGWIYATYLWSGDAAIRAPREGVDVPVTDSAIATHRVPSHVDCVACHANGASPVLGFSSLQLSTDRDPRAPHREVGGVDLMGLAIAGYLDDIDDIAPRIPGPPAQRAALGYLHGNCGGCHRAEGPLAGLGMVFAQGDATVRTTAGIASRYNGAARLTPGDASHSVLIARMSARRTPAQMPPIGTDVVDAEALHLVADWIDQLAPTNP